MKASSSSRLGRYGVTVLRPAGRWFLSASAVQGALLGAQIEDSAKGRGPIARREPGAGRRVWRGRRGRQTEAVSLPRRRSSRVGSHGVSLVNSWLSWLVLHLPFLPKYCFPLLKSCLNSLGGPEPFLEWFFFFFFKVSGTINSGVFVFLVICTSVFPLGINNSL